MDEAVVKWLGLGAAVLLLVGAIVLGVRYKTQSDGINNAASNKYAKVTADLADADVDSYDGTTLSGSEVLNVIKKFDDTKISIRVVTKKSTSYYGYSLNANNDLVANGTTSLTKAKEMSNNAYINPTGIFSGSILKDQNDVKTGICFTQE